MADQEVPRDKMLNLRLLDVNHNLAQIAIERGSLNEALATYEQNLRMLEYPISDFPEVAEYQERLTVT